MESQMYQEMMEVEDKHWWFVARRSIIEQVIKKLNLPANAEIFEAGCGTGGNLAMLSHHGKVYGMELDETAQNFFNCYEGKRLSLPDRFTPEQQFFEHHRNYIFIP
jgi:cyclopropane fatty-acyl-phospholipid synthase-like methyltransferase